MRELVLKKCIKCGAIIKVIDDCNCNDCGIKCCNEDMKIVKANSVDAAFEKHIPTFEVKGSKLIVTVNHVMEDDHFIEWICLVTDDKEEYKYFTSKEEATCEFKNVHSGTLYSYCNKHGLWQNNI